MNHTTKLNILKHICYALGLFLFYVFQTTPGLSLFMGAKPVWVLSFALSIAMLEGEFVGGIYGAVAGLLCDLSSFSLFGFNGFFFCLSCIGAGLLVIYLMHSNLSSCLIFVAASLTVTKSIEFFFAYGMWGYDHVFKLYLGNVLPVILSSMLFAPLCYSAAHRLHDCFDAIEEEKS